jgi:bifunctional non-homologous end joining protein LigD
VTDRTVRIGRRKLELSRVDKVLFPDSGITKEQLVGHYRRVAGVALPHYRDRPLSMHRFPDGIGQEGFYQKDLPDYAPEWIPRVELPRKEGGSVTYALANDEATLAWLADQACITPHLFLSRCDRPQHPDRLVFDLDPSTDDFRPVQQAALWLKDLLDMLELPSYVQTTGSRGLHVIVPLDRRADFDEARDFARGVADCLASEHPDALTTEQRKSKRGDRLFIDWLRNAYGQTSVAPYAVRAIEGAPVVTPLDWDEVGASSLNAQRYHLGNIGRRLGQKDDPWRDIARHGHSVKPAERRLAALRP